MSGLRSKLQGRGPEILHDDCAVACLGRYAIAIRIEPRKFLLLNFSRRRKAVDAHRGGAAFTLQSLGWRLE